MQLPYKFGAVNKGDFGELFTRRGLHVNENIGLKRMPKVQSVCTKEQALPTVGFIGLSVQIISDNAMPCTTQMPAELMGPTGLGVELDEADLACASDFPVGDCVTSRNGVLAFQ